MSLVTWTCNLCGETLERDLTTFVKHTKSCTKEEPKTPEEVAKTFYNKPEDSALREQEQQLWHKPINK